MPQQITRRAAVFDPDQIDGGRERRRRRPNGGALIWIKLGPRLSGHVFVMSRERANDLARLCTEVVRKGDDFPTIWQTLLKGHPLVDGIPQQKLDGNRSILEISLITGERLVYDGDARRFSLR